VKNGWHCSRVWFDLWYCVCPIRELGL